jgi:hypothetical protein
MLPNYLFPKTKEMKMLNPLTPRPIIYEINTWAWLNELGRNYNRLVTLENVPSEQWDAIASLSVDAVWLMGVWERSSEGIRISSYDAEKLKGFRAVLSDFDAKDNIGSAYCIRGYSVDEHLGGPAGLARARKELAQRSMRLILDFVPNHTAIDHPWVLKHPEYYVQGTPEDLFKKPGEFIEVGGHVLAKGRDPNYPPWIDVVQIDAFHPGLRREITRTIEEIADQCDGVRCDMSMLVINHIFKNTWGEHTFEPPHTEYWENIISTSKGKNLNFIFIAEAYWDTESELLKMGFDLCYDKRLYDRLRFGSAESIRQHLTASLDYQDHMVRFIENHDEDRAASTFGLLKERGAAVAVMTIPGAKMIYHGQIEGRKVKSSVFLGREEAEPINQDLRAFYLELLLAIKDSGIQTGEWQLCERTGWPDNSSYHNLLAWCWRQGEKRYLVVINYSAFQSQARVRLPWDDLDKGTWHLNDPINGDAFERSGREMLGEGLFVDLAAWSFHFLQMKAD